MCVGVKRVQLAVQGHKSWVLCLAWSPDGLMVATGGMEGALWLWDPKTGNPIGCCRGAVHDAVSPSARVLRHVVEACCFPPGTGPIRFWTFRRLRACSAAGGRRVEGLCVCARAQATQSGSQPLPGSQRTWPCQQGALSAARRTPLSRCPAPLLLEVGAALSAQHMTVI
jgi:hypothetical protein